MSRAARLARFAAFVISAACASASPQSTDGRLAEIRALYAGVQSRISQAVKDAPSGGASGIYSTDLIVNSHNGSWRAVGTYSRKTRYWFTDQPEFARREGRPESSVLVKVEISETAAARTTRKELLFDQGQLVFAFIRGGGDAAGADEQRFCFDKGRAFRYLEGSKPAAIPEDQAAALLREASSLRTSFLATF